MFSHTQSNNTTQRDGGGGGGRVISYLSWAMRFLRSESPSLFLSISLLSRRVLTCDTSSRSFLCSDFDTASTLSVAALCKWTKKPWNWIPIVSARNHGTMFDAKWMNEIMEPSSIHTAWMLSERNRGITHPHDVNEQDHATTNPYTQWSVDGWTHASVRGWTEPWNHPFQSEWAWTNSWNHPPTRRESLVNEGTDLPIYTGWVKWIPITNQCNAIAHWTPH